MFICGFAIKNGENLKTSKQTINISSINLPFSLLIRNPFNSLEINLRLRRQKTTIDGFWFLF